eukprot:CAMPEP_0119129362 /NCGR_PEP_ID=MMETSP1310-20130426/7143_1 /TAXON_ID=464262 /ORGANISM="Genus nov. species nov., Strain RCC2339" /LENGTH=83 /DNA_ID=CAMNT_0007119781 /DNA_START=302 /DNA_END=553 /DNA_ORIENTATION=-
MAILLNPEDIEGKLLVKVSRAQINGELNTFAKVKQSTTTVGTQQGSNVIIAGRSVKVQQVILATPEWTRMYFEIPILAERRRL